MKKRFFFVCCIIVISVSCTNRPDLVEEFYPDGIIKSETEVVNGLRNGISKTYDERGRLTSTATFVNDKYEGWMITYNPLNSKITAKAMYKNDYQDGPVILYYAEGQLYREEFYKNGRVDSIVKTYWPDGKLQAEVEFDMGKPGLGLKEFDRAGNPVKQPTLIIEEINQLRTNNSFKLKIYLSNNDEDVNYYTGELIEEKFLDPNAIKVVDKEGITYLQYNILKQHRVSKYIGISAKVRTEFGNTLLLHQGYHLNISN
jgi:antitoxin component YwqK of YwqJK toxin-antitoxin module